MTSTDAEVGDDTGNGATAPTDTNTDAPASVDDQAAGSDSPARAELIAERDFLLASLDDLDAELAAGDIDAADHRALSDDYTARAAAVLRALEDGEEPSGPLGAPEAAPTSWKRRALTIAGVVLAAAVVGWALSQALGTRRPGDVNTGEIRQTVRNDLLDAFDFFVAGEFDEADALYAEVLEREPSNAEALAYRGWMYWRSGDPALRDPGLEFLESATRADPDYSDARAFYAVALEELGRDDEAREQLEAFDASNPSPTALSIVNGTPNAAGPSLRERLSGTAVPQPGVDPRLIEAAALFREGGDDNVTRALDLYEDVLADDPTNVDALNARGFVWVSSGVGALSNGNDQGTVLIDRGIVDLSAATSADPNRPDAFGLLAVAYAGLKQWSDAADALAAFDAAGGSAEVESELDFWDVRNRVEAALAEG